MLFISSIFCFKVKPVVKGSSIKDFRKAFFEPAERTASAVMLIPFLRIYTGFILAEGMCERGLCFKPPVSGAANTKCGQCNCIFKAENVRP